MKYTNKQLTGLWLLFFLIAIASCKKNDQKQDNLNQTGDHSAEVVLKWLNFKYSMMIQNATSQQIRKPGSADQYINRYHAYLGVALYESVVPGMPAYRSLSGQLTGLPPMPPIEQGKEYHWAASANTALAYLNRNLLYTATAATKSTIDSLEGALNTQYKTEVDSATFQRSADFGKAVAKAVFDWSETDGINTVYPPYVPPVGPGLWVPTPPNFSAPTAVHYGDFRPLMPGVLTEVLPGPPQPYSIDPASDFYKNQKEVYEARTNRTAADSLQAEYWRQNAQHWYAILKKMITEQGSAAMLDKAALADCKMGIALFDAAIATFKTKYTYNVIRPVTYIRNVMGHTTWNPQFATLANPDYPDGVVADYAASAGALSSVFGKNYRLNTEGTNNSATLYQGYTFNSFEEAANHGGRSRFLAGVTTKPAVDVGLAIGFKTAAYMDKTIRFLK